MIGKYEEDEILNVLLNGFSVQTSGTWWEEVVFWGEMFVQGGFLRSVKGKGIKVYNYTC